MSELKVGDEVKTRGLKTAKVIKELGRGGQGIVYEVDYSGEKKALKWYYKTKLSHPEEFYNNIKSNIDQGKPTDAFLWMEDITDWVDGTFGYIMPLRPKEFKDFSQYLLAKVKPKNLAVLVDVALNIVSGFEALHKAGYNYQDLNDGNFFVNFDTGDVLICDNDNVMGHGYSSGIAGKARYMAPEVVLGSTPNKQTDRYSLAVVLFLLLVVNHPLEGKATNPPCMTEELERKIYGSNPLFIFDPENGTNSPIPGLHMNAINRWPALPQYIRNAFESEFSQNKLHLVESFTCACNKKHLVGPNETKTCEKCKNEFKVPPKAPRMLESEWLRLLIRLRGEIYQHSCGNELLVNPLGSVECEKCKKNVSILAHLKFNKLNSPLFSEALLYACHTSEGSEDFKTITAEVIPSKTNPNALGLRNLSDVTWYVTGPNGKTIPKTKDEVIKIANGLKIDFGKNLIAEIVGN